MESAVSANVQQDILVHHAKIHHVIRTINALMVEHVLFRDPVSHVIVLMDSLVHSVKSRLVINQ